MDIFEKCVSGDVVKRVAELQANDVYPYFHHLDSGQDIVVSMENHRVIMLGSNNYLGLTSNPEIKEAAIKAIEKYGSGVSGSRFLNGTLDIHVKLESDLAEFLHKEACLTFSTGFMSNLAIISAIAGRNDYIICDKENHASIYDACRLSYAKMLRYEHADMEDLERQLQAVPPGHGILIVSDGVFSMGGDICKLPKMVELKKKYGARIMLDDAHAFGVIGEHGRGTGEFYGLEDEVDIIMGTFSKSLASLGGFMAANADVVNFVKHTSRPFIFAAAITPASVASTQKALDILKREPERVKNLQDIANFMRKELTRNNVPLRKTENTIIPIIPIETVKDFRTFYACKTLFDKGVYVNSAVSPAVPKGEAIIRTSYTATHTKELMTEAADIIGNVFKNELVEFDKKYPDAD